MELCSYPVAFSMFFYVTELSLFWGLVNRIRPRSILAVTTAFASFFSAVFTFLFAFVGTLVGAFTGGLIGQETESGFVRGAAVGAISGAVFSIEAFEDSRVLWQSEKSVFSCILHLINAMISLVSGRLVRERIAPAMLSAEQNQTSTSEVRFEDVPNLFDTSIFKGMTKESMEKLPKVTINSNLNVDESGENVCCSVCLQDFELGETTKFTSMPSHISSTLHR